MKTLIVAATAALLAVPAIADTNAANFAADHFAQSYESGDGSRGVPPLTGEGEIISTKGDLAIFADDHLANGPEDKR